MNLYKLLQHRAAQGRPVRGGLIGGLYNQKAVWPIFGYEGASYEEGGYMDRGFNDINWL